MKILDFSKYNTITDWNAVKANCDGIILRCGVRGYSAGNIKIDAKFPEFAEKCRDFGIPFGVYFMSQAITEQEGREEAAFSVALANQYGATLPVFIDSEDGDGTKRKAGRIWMNISGTNREEWVCADDGKRSYIY